MGRRAAEVDWTQQSLPARKLGLKGMYQTGAAPASVKTVAVLIHVAVYFSVAYAFGLQLAF